MQWDRADYYANKKTFEGPVGAAPWRGFVAEYRRRGDPASKSRKKNELLWAEQVNNDAVLQQQKTTPEAAPHPRQHLMVCMQVMDGLRRDQVELVEEGYRYRLSEPNCRVTGGTCGAPFHYGRASFFTQEQVDQLTETKKQQLEQFASDRRMFLGRHEWRDVLEPLPLVATYMTPQPWVERARRGDTGLSLAIRCLRFDAALVMVQKVGMDALTCNCEGESAADLLALQLVRVDEELAEIEQLQYRRQSNILRYGITDEQEARIKRQPLWELKRLQANRLAGALARSAEAFLAEQLGPTKHKASRCLIEGFSLSPEEEAVLSREPFVTAFLQTARRTFAATDDSPLPEAFDPELQELRRRQAAITRLQTWWRGTRTRRAMRRRRMMLAAYRLQLLFKLLLARRRFLRRKQQEEEQEQRGAGWDLKRPDLSAGIMELLAASQHATATGGGNRSSTVRRSSSLLSSSTLALQDTKTSKQQAKEETRASVSHMSQSAAATVRDLLARSHRRSSGGGGLTSTLPLDGQGDEGAASKSLRDRRAAFRSSSTKSFGQSLGRLTSGLASVMMMGGTSSSSRRGGRASTPPEGASSSSLSSSAGTSRGAEEDTTARPSTPSPVQ